MAIAFEFDPRGRSTADKDSSNKENTQAAADLRSFLSNRHFNAYFAKLPAIGEQPTPEKEKQQPALPNIPVDAPTATAATAPEAKAEPAPKVEAQPTPQGKENPFAAPTRPASHAAQAPIQKKTFLDQFRTKVAIAVIAAGTFFGSFYFSKKQQQADRAGAEGNSKAVPVEVTKSTDRNAPPQSVVSVTPAQTNATPSTTVAATNAPAATKTEAAPKQVLGPVAPVDPLAFLGNALDFLKGSNKPAVRPPLAPPAAPETASNPAKPAEKPTTSPAASAPSTNNVAAATGAASSTATPATATPATKPVAPSPFVNLSTQELGDLLSDYSSKAHLELKLTSESEQGWERATELAKADGVDLVRAAKEYQARKTFESMSTEELSALVSKYGTLGHQELKLTTQSKEGWARASELAKQDNIDLELAGQVLKSRKAQENPQDAQAKAPQAQANPFESMSTKELAALVSKYGTLGHQDLKLTTESKEGWARACELAKKDNIDLEQAGEVLKARQAKAAPQASNDASLRVAMNLDQMTTPELNALLQGYRTRAMQELGAKEESQQTWNKAAELAAKDGVQLDKLIDRVNAGAKAEATPAKPSAKVTSPRKEVKHKAVLNTPGRSTSVRSGSGKEIVKEQPTTASTQPALSKVSTAQLEATLVEYSNRGKAAVQAQKGASYDVPVEEAMRAGKQIAAQEGVSLVDIYTEYMSRTGRGGAQSSAQAPSAVGAKGYSGTKGNNAAAQEASPQAQTAATEANLLVKPRELEKMIKKQPAYTPPTGTSYEVSILSSRDRRGRTSEVLMVDNEVVGMKRERRFLFFKLPTKVVPAPGLTKAEFKAQLAGWKEKGREFSERAGLSSPETNVRVAQKTVTRAPAARNVAFQKRGAEQLATRNG